MILLFSFVVHQHLQNSDHYLSAAPRRLRDAENISLELFSYQIIFRSLLSNRTQILIRVNTS